MIPSSFRIELTSEDTFPRKVILQETTESTKSLTIGGRNYKVEGDEKSVALFHEQIKDLSSKEFKSVTDFSASFKEHGKSGAIKRTVSEVATPIFHQRLSKQIIKKILASNGSKQEIMRIFTEIPSTLRENVVFLMDISQELAKRGAIIKANLFFTLVPLNPENSEQMDHCIFRMGQALLETGKRTFNIDALNCAYDHLSSVKFYGSSPREAIQTRIDEVVTHLQQIAREGEPPNNKRAAEILDFIEIRETLGTIPVGSKEELLKLRLENSRVDRAFKLAEAIQRQVDSEQDPLTAPPGRIVPITTKGGNTIPMHVNITGKRRPGEPFVILEGGQGVISTDWQLVQRSMPKNIQVMSYDRAGMGWSGRGTERPTAKNSLANLEELLKSLDIAPPYVFVGHSYGGFLGQLFALGHPGQVSGLVMVDSSVEGILPLSVGKKQNAFDYIPPAAHHSLFQNKRVHFFDEATSSVLHRVTSRTDHLMTFEQEGEEFAPSSVLLTDVLRTLPRVPISCRMKVITAKKENIEGGEIADRGRWEKWLEGQRRLPERSIAGTQVISEKSDHFIMYHDPLIVIEQVCSLFTRS